MGAGSGAVSASLWTIGSATAQQTLSQAVAGLAVGALVAAACGAAWSRALPRRAVHVLGVLTCWLTATGLLVAFTGNLVGSAVLSLPSLVLGLAITMPVLMALESGTPHDLRA